jgi:hypothetical protein
VGKKIISREERRRILGLRKINPSLFQVTDDMLRKNMLPDDFPAFDDSIFRSMSYNHGIEPFKEHTCMECQITIFGPKKLLLEHHKIHIRKDKYDKENELATQKYLEYY